jgi:hypothetical protein
MGEIDLPKKTFPLECLYNLTEILDEFFYPGEPSEIIESFERE